MREEGREVNKTDIEYLDYTWNPIAMRCNPVSAGCANCWHLRMCKRMAANPRIADFKREAYAGGGSVLDEWEIEAPFRLKRRARIGVQFMGDLFHESVSDAMVEKVFTAMVNAQWIYGHKFLILTKRPKRMAEVIEAIRNGIEEQKKPVRNEDGSTSHRLHFSFPLENLWLGVSVENQKAADERIPILLQTPAAVRWVSVEPILEAIDLRLDMAEPGFLHDKDCGGCCDYGRGGIDTQGNIDWVVCGAESGPGARTCNLSWVLSLRNQCVDAGVPFFYKQGPNEFCFQNLLMPFLEGKQWAQMPEVKR